jgi:hypothetical protein
MTLKSLLSFGLCAAMVPALGATGNWTEALEVRLVAGVQAPTVEPDPPVRAGRIERQRVEGDLEAAIAAIQRTDAGPLWIGWRVPAESTRRSPNQARWGDPRRCVLEDDGRVRGDGFSVHGDTDEISILLRSESDALTRVVFTDVRCPVDAGSRTVYWLDGVSPEASVALLAEFVESGWQSGEEARRPGKDALPALAMHRTSAADAALTAFTTPDRPRALRKDAAFWLAAARGSQGAAAVERLARTDADERFRDHLTFVLTLTGERGTDTLIDLARTDASTKVRRQALFWLGQQAGTRAVAAVEQAVDDPDRAIRKHAVFSLSQLPSDEGVPRLIEVARTHRDPEVRKQAMFWLGQSGDERAVTFFESLLKPE